MRSPEGQIGSSACLSKPRLYGHSRPSDGWHHLYDYNTTVRDLQGVLKNFGIFFAAIRSTLQIRILTDLYSDVNIRNRSLKDAMNSPLFRKLREEGYLLEEHSGGCVLYEKREQIEKLINA